MAVSSAGLGPSARITVLGVCCIVLLTCGQVRPAGAGKHKRHPPVQAFFQGHCDHDFCDQRCRDVDNGGYVCECYDGYRLNHDGITCSKATKENIQEYNLERPHVVKIITVDEEKDDSATVTQSDSVKSDGAKNWPTVPGDSARRPQGSDVDLTVNYSQTLDSHNSVLLSDNEGPTAIRIKVETYDHNADAPKLESQALTSADAETARTDKELTNLVPNLLPKYTLTNKKLGNGYFDEIPVKQGGKCDEFSCLNHGRCVDDGTVYRNQVRCDCSLGYLGDRCEKEVEVRYPRFYGNSFVALPVLKNGHQQLEVVLEFKPTAQYGLLFFTSEFQDARSDFFSIALNEGFVEFRYDCGTGMGIIRSETTIIMDEWNTLRIHRHDNTATLWLNGGRPVSGTSKGSYSRLTLRLNLYIGGYDQLALVKDKVGTQKGFVGCVEQVIVNGYKYDLRKASLVGDAQFGANVGECSEGVCNHVVCQNNGLCQIISADRHICLCPIGTGGENCQHKNHVHLPEFQGHSYLEYEGLGRDALLFLEMELVIKPTRLSGTVLYNGYTVDRQGDFISLALQEGHLEFRFDLGTGPAVLRSPKPLSVNMWHWVRVSRTGLEGVLEVDGEVVAVGQAQGAFTQLTLTQNLFVGGHRNYDETSKYANVSQGFDGCIQKIVINNRPLRLLEDAIFGVNVESCEHPCVGQPCLHGGECMPERDVYTCSCPLGRTGNNCQQEVDKAIHNPQFTGNSYLMYTQKWVAKRIGGDGIDIRFSIKPLSRDGLLLWSGPDVMLATSDYVALGFVQGALQFRYNLGSGEAVISYNNSRLYDGHWHFVHAQRRKQDGFLSVDGREIVEGSSKGSYTMLNTNKILYIGGTPDVSHSTIKKFSGGLVGCLQDLVLNEDYSLHVLQSADAGRNVIQCS